MPGSRSPGRATAHWSRRRPGMKQAMQAWLLLGWATIVLAGGCAKPAQTTDEGSARAAGTAVPPGPPVSLVALPTGERSMEVCRLIVAKAGGRDCKPVLPVGDARGPLQFEIVGSSGRSQPVPGIVFAFVDDWTYRESLAGLSADMTTVETDGRTRVVSLVLGSSAAWTVVVVRNELSPEDEGRLRAVVDGLR